MGGSSKKRLWVGAALIVFLLLATGAAFVMSTWAEVDKVSIDRPETPVVVAAADSEEPAPDAEEEPEDRVAVPSTEDGVDVFLIVGSDSREDLESLEGFGQFEGERADVVMVMLRPRSSDRAAVLSLPRDLLVPDLCRDGEHRLNEAITGCEDEFNGPTELVLTVESLIGVTIDHFAMADLAGFQEAVDAVGGYEICVENPVRDWRAKLDLPAGCTMATGEETLAWMRSRSTQELTDSGWRVMPGVNDLTRNERQRDFMVELLGRLSDFSSPQDLAAAARALAPYLTVDADLGLVDAVGLAWTMRGLGDESVETIEVAVADATTDNGAAVLVAVDDIAAVVDGFLHPRTAQRSALASSG